MGGCNEGPIGDFAIGSQGDALELDHINILDFERRVKRFVTPESCGYISERQLIESFKDLKTFDGLLMTNSAVYRLIYSPFVQTLPIGARHEDLQKFLNHRSETHPSGLDSEYTSNTDRNI